MEEINEDEKTNLYQLLNNIYEPMKKISECYQELLINYNKTKFN